MSWFGKKEPAPSSTPTAKPAPAASVPAGRPKAGKVSTLLEPTAVVVSQSGDKEAVLKDVVSRICAARGFANPDVFLARVLEREKGISTTLDTGLSLPHARMDDIPGIVAGLAVLPKPISDPQQPELSIRVMFVFFSPNKPEAFPLHLQLLRSVSSLFQPALIDQLTQAASPAAVIELIKTVEA